MSDRYYTFHASQPERESGDEPVVVYGLNRITEEAPASIPHALVVARGKEARRMIADVEAAGMKPFAIYTEDHTSPSYARAAAGSVYLGATCTPQLMGNAHAVLSAAQACAAQVILLCGESAPLAHVDSFLAEAKARGILVYEIAGPEQSYLAWRLCETDREPVPDDAWLTCRSCGLTFSESPLAKSSYRCPACGTYFRLTSDQRINDLLDIDSFQEWDADLPERDPLDFPGYLEKIDGQRRKTGLREAVRCGQGRIAGLDCAIAIMESTFLMGSMGSVVGEKIARMFDHATEEGLPAVVFCASGGARMQEGLVSLMQMAKVSCAVERHAKAGLLYISVICDPTTGGVTASFATQGDIILAETGALLGFAGKRVIRDTIRQELPEGFQSAEFALEHGLVDAVVPREQLRMTIAQLLAMHHRPAEKAMLPGETREIITYEGVCASLKSGHGTYNHVTFGREEIAPAPQERRRLIDVLRKGLFSRKPRVPETALSPQAEQVPVLRKIRAAAPEKVEGNTAWDSVQTARNTHRPTSIAYIRRIFDGFIELHGDRQFGDDGAIVAGIGWLGCQAITVIAEEKGETLKERVRRNFGCPQPEGYRKGIRLMKQAEKFGRPVVCFVDTQGAFCGAEAEERGQGNAIAESLLCMAGLEVPVISVIIGEGGSGGALALALSNSVAIQENAVYSVLSPEGFASILWKDRSRAPEAAAAMKMSAEDIVRMGIADEMLSEGVESADKNPDAAIKEVEAYLRSALAELSDRDADELVQQRQERFAGF
ncbi:acetyl-CoA carboxylase, carboxyltransferase subunit beta [Curtanaerobium respiraculi]|uniref:acetyl-CoA carboxylase, carboxyltransferase subunit beta n=1 Tax=Curtanaerobium respiraculi TaxID=2949669 RepID=UPI0024B38AA4|nr:acetyl-CoA carboxylase, carboxyltransferase subunit beta [Curtanaerobium respiraculi]